LSQERTNQQHMLHEKDVLKAQNVFQKLLNYVESTHSHTPPHFFSIVYEKINFQLFAGLQLSTKNWYIGRKKTNDANLIF
jgi:hypothetical protein